MSQLLPSKPVHPLISKGERCHVASILTLKLTNKATQSMKTLVVQTLNPVGDSTRLGEEREREKSDRKEKGENIKYDGEM